MAQGTTKGVPIDKDPLLALDSDLVVPSQKAIKAYVDAKKSAADSDYINVAGDTMIGNLILNADPTINLGAATKQYVDNYINGLDYKAAAHVGTVAALPAYTVSVNKLVLTGTANGPIPTATFDGHDPTIGQRVLIKDETSTLTPNNGIYVLTQVGNVSNPFILTRSADADSSAELGEATLSIINGATLSNTIWHCNPASVPIVIGTTNLTFIELGSGSVGTGVANELTYWSSTTSLGSLTGNITITKKFLSQTGNGTITSAPVWGVLEAADIPNLSATKITSGTLAVANGGTGATTLTGVIIGNGTAAMTEVAGTASQILRRKADNTGYEFVDPVAGATDLSYDAATRLLSSSTGTDVTLPIMGFATASTAGTAGLVPAPGIGQQNLYLTGAGTWATQVATGTITAGTDRRLGIYQATTTTLASTTSGSNAVIVSIDSTTAARTYNIPDAGANAAFVMTQGTQTIAGSKTFSSVVAVNSSTTVSAVNSGQILINGSASTPTTQGTTISFINFYTTSSAAPANQSVRSNGTRIVLQPNMGTSQVDAAIGYNDAEKETWITGAQTVATEGKVSFYSAVSSGLSRVGYFGNTGLVFDVATKGVTFSNGGFVNWQTTGTGAPSTGTRSAGTKLVLRSNVGTAYSDYAIGVDSTNYETWISGGGSVGLNNGMVSFWVGSNNFKRTVWVTENQLNLALSTVMLINAQQVVGARKIGWATATGTAAKTTFATFTTQTISNPPTQAQVQAISDHVVILSQRMKALIDDLHATAGHGLIGT
jgi:hypothetical protein